MYKPETIEVQRTKERTTEMCITINRQAPQRRELFRDLVI